MEKQGYKMSCEKVAKDWKCSSWMNANCKMKDRLEAVKMLEESDMVEWLYKEIIIYDLM
jgi:hypothetical protein